MKPIFYKSQIQVIIERSKSSPINEFKKFFLKASYIILLLYINSHSALAQGTYTWTGATSDFQVSTNWSPNRGTLNAGDVLIFTSAGTQTVTNVPNQTVATITVQSSAAITLQPATTNSLTLGVALSVAANCSLTISNNLSLTNGGTIIVNGLLDFNGASPNAPGGVTVNSTGELRFDGSGTAVINGPSIAGGTFTVGGTVSISGVSGSAATYTSGSTLQYKTNTSPVNTGKEFPASIDNLVISNVGANNKIVMTSDITVTGTTTGLNITKGALTLNTHTLNMAGLANGVSVVGRIFVDAAATLNFSGSVAGNIGTLYFVGASIGNVIVNLTGLGSSVTFGNGLKVATALTMTTGLIKMPDGIILTYIGSSANLSPGSSSSYVSFINSSTINYGFYLGDGLTSMTAGSYALPVGPAATGSPVVNGYRPITVTWSSTTTNYFRVGFMSVAGISTSSSDIRTSVNNRAGYFTNIVTNVASYNLTMSYANSDFTSAPAIGNVNIYSWGLPNNSLTNSLWNVASPCQAANSTGTINTITFNGVTVSSGLLALGQDGGSDLYRSGTFYWTGATSTKWEDSTNWTGPCGSYPGKYNQADIAVVNTSGTFGLPVITSSSGQILIGQLQVDGVGNNVTLKPGSWLGVSGVSGSTAASIQTTNSGTVSADPASTIDYRGAGNSPWSCDIYEQHINTSFTYGNLVLSDSNATGLGGTCKYIDASVSIAGNLGVLNNVRCYLTGTTTVSGNVSVLGSITSYTTAYLTMNGTGVTLSGTSPVYLAPTLVIAGTVNVINNVTEAGGLTVNSGNTLTLSANFDASSDNVVTTNNGTITINNGYTLSLGSKSYANSGVIQSASNNGGTVSFINNDDNCTFTCTYLNDTLYLPSGIGSGGSFNAASGNQVSLAVYGRFYCCGYGLPVYLDKNISTLTIYNLAVDNASGHNLIPQIFINSGQVLISNGNNFQNWITSGITGPGTIHFNGTVSIPAGSGTGGTFNSATGYIPHLTVGNGSTTNTVTASAAVTVNNDTVNAGAFEAVNSGITLSVAGNVICSGTIQDGSSNGTLSMISASPATIDGGTSGTHGQFTISQFTISTTGAARTFNSTAYIDFSASTFVYDGLPTTVTNNGTILFNGTSFGSVLGGCAQGFLTSSNQVFNNTGTCTVVGAFNIGNCGWSNTVNNTGTINCSNMNVYIINTFNNNNGGVVHCTGAGGIVASGPGQDFQYWYNNAGSWVDVAGPFFEVGGINPYGTLVCNSATNTVEYDGTGTQIIYPTQYNNLTIAKTVGSNNATLTNGNDTVNGILTFAGGNIDAFTSGNRVVITSTGSVSGVSQTTGWVNGKVEKDGSTDFTFPVGKQTADYRPMSVTNLSASDKFTAEYFDVNPNNAGYDVYALAVTLTNVSHCEYWMLNNTGSSSAYVTLSWDNIYSCGVTAPPDLRVAEWNSALWTDQGNTGTSVINQTVRSVTVASFNQPFTLASTDSVLNPLPITLLSFIAKADGNHVDLDWSTASEINNNYFTIEKTRDMVNYTSVATVKGAGNSTSIINYHSVDANPYDGVSYYRLEQTDFDNKSSYSALEAVNFNLHTTNVTVFPNPVSSLIYLSAPSSISYTMHIYDAKGSEVIAPVTLTFDEGKVQNLDVSSFVNGVYIIRLISDKDVQQVKFVKE